MNYPNKLTIEIDITHRCNLHCRHCNRLCNAESMYGVVREHKDMEKNILIFMFSNQSKPQGESRTSKNNWR